MSEIENYIEQKKADWPQPELPDGHLSRFEYRLDRKANQTAFSGMGFWRIAAAIAIIVAVGISLLIPNWNSSADVQYGSLSLGDVSSELSEVERYYQSEVAKAYDELDSEAAKDTLLAVHFTALKSLNEEYQNLERELYQSSSHQKVIDAMIVNFRLRLELIAEIERIHKQISTTNKPIAL